MIDPDKVQTRGGFDFRIYTTKAKGVFPIIGEAEAPIGGWFNVDWNEDGAFSGGDGHHPYDLVPKPAPERTVDVWLNVYSDQSVSVHPTSHAAVAWGSLRRVACKHLTVTFREGEFE